jgi:hypothetical protein
VEVKMETAGAEHLGHVQRRAGQNEPMAALVTHRLGHQKKKKRPSKGLFHGGMIMRSRENVKWSGGRGPTTSLGIHAAAASLEIRPGIAPQAGSRMVSWDSGVFARMIRDRPP